MNHDLINSDMYFILENHGKDVLVNDTETKALISYYQNMEYNDCLKIITQYPITRGSLVEYQDNYFLIISDVTDQRHNAYYRAIMRRCNHTLNIQVGTEEEIVDYDPLGRPIIRETPIFATFHCIVDSQSLKIGEQQQINIAENRITITMQDNEDSDALNINDTIELDGYTWHIRNKDRFSQPGLIIFTCDRGSAIIE